MQTTPMVGEGVAGHAPQRDLRPVPAAPAAFQRRLSMQWQTPQASDFRFGFEITMYVAKR